MPINEKRIMYSKVIQYYREVKERSNLEYDKTVVEYRDMATGGNGGSLNGSTLRDRYYRGYGDSFFRAVLEGLGESLGPSESIDP